MRVAIFHGFELTGSGSNEYTRYLSRALARQGHDVHVLCREPDPAAIPHVARAFAWDASGKNRRLFSRDAGDEGVTLHQLANGAVRPVYVTDKQRAGNVKAFESLTDDELSAYHAESVRLVDLVLGEYPVRYVSTTLRHSRAAFSEPRLASGGSWRRCGPHLHRSRSRFVEQKKGVPQVWTPPREWLVRHSGASFSPSAG